MRGKYRNVLQAAAFKKNISVVWFLLPSAADKHIHGGELENVL